LIERKKEDFLEIEEEAMTDIEVIEKEALAEIEGKDSEIDFF